MVKWSESSIANNSVRHKSFICTQFKCQTVLFDPKIGPYQVLPLWACVDLGAMVMKGYATFPKAPALLGVTIRWFNVISRTLIGDLTPHVKTQSVYSTAPADWAELRKREVMD